MADFRRTRDYQPELTFAGNPDVMGVDSGGPANEGLSLPSNAPLNNEAQYIEEGSGVRVDPRSFASGTVPAYVNPDDDAISGTQFFSGMGQLGSAVGNDLASLGRLGMRGLDAITPSRDTLAGIGQYFQDAHAIGTGQTPLYMMQQQHAMNMQQNGQMMAYRREQLANQLAQVEESKRQHNMQIMEKLLASGNIDALEEFGKEYPPAALLAKATTGSDMMEIPSYIEKGWLSPKDVSDFQAGKMTPNVLKVKLGQLRKRAEIINKHEAETADLRGALNKDYTTLDPYEKSLVDDYRGKIDLNKAKTDETESQTDERKAHAEWLRKQVEMGGKNQQNYGHDREALSQQMFGGSYGQQSPANMAKINDKLLHFQGQQQLNKSTAVQQAQLAVPDKATDTEREKSVGDLSTLDLIDKMGKNYSADWVGPIRGRYGAATETFGGIGEDEAQFRADVATLKNKVIKEVTGAQMSEPEAKRILSQVPDAINPDPVFRARLKSTRENLKIVAKRRREILEKTGVDTSTLPSLPGGKKASTQPATQQPDKIQSVLDEVFGGK